MTPYGGCSSTDTWTANWGSDSLGRGLYWVNSITPSGGKGSGPTTVNYLVFTSNLNYAHPVPVTFGRRDPFGSLFS